MKIADETFLNNGLTSIANKIREVSNTTYQMAFPQPSTPATTFNYVINAWCIDNYWKTYLPALLYIANYASITDTGSLSSSMLNTGYQQKIIINCSGDIPVSSILNYDCTTVYATDGDTVWDVTNTPDWCLQSHSGSMLYPETTYVMRINGILWAMSGPGDAKTLISQIVNGADISINPWPTY